MQKMRIISSFLIIFGWLVTSAFQPLPISPAAVDAPAAFTKVAPANGATGLSTTGVTLEWSSTLTNVTYQYCYRAGKSGCPGNKWVNVGTALSAPLPALTSGITYWWQVRAVDNTTQAITEADAGGWYWFSTLNNANLPGAFSKLTPPDASLDVAVSGLGLSWGVSARATRYEYCYDTLNDDQCGGSWTNAGTATTATLSGLAYNTPYYWQVRAVNSYGNFQANGGVWWSFRTRAAPPGAFSKISPADSASDQLTNLTLTWETSPGATYQYCLDTNFGETCASDGAWTSTNTTPSADITGLSYNTTYYWQVKATIGSTVTLANEGVYWSFTTRIAPPGPFGKTSPGDASTGQLLDPTLAWEASAGDNVTYEYCYSTTKTAQNACNGTWYLAGTATSASLSGLSNATLYYWQVRAVNTSGTTYANGSADALWSFTTQISAPWAFDKITPASGTTGVPVNVTLEWSPSAGATRYFYCVDNEAVNNNTCDSGWVLIDNTNTSASPTTLVTGQTYFWQVYAENSQGDLQADGGTWWSFTTIDSPPSGFSKISPMDLAVDQPLSPWLYWSSSAGVESYQYCISATASCPDEASWKTVTPVATNTFVKVSSLASNTLYYWQVRAANIGGTEYANGTTTWWSFRTVKEPPVVSDLNFQTLEDTPLVSAHLSVVSANYSPLTYTLVGSLPAGTLDFHSDGIFTYTPVANFNGSVSFKFIVSDGYNPPSAPRTATITIYPVNDPPVLQAIPDLVVKTGSLATFTAIATDADTPYGDTLTYSIEETLPQGATFNSVTGTFRWTPKWLPGPASNVYTFNVVVTDTDTPIPNTARQVVQITVLPQQLWLPIIFR